MRNRVSLLALLVLTLVVRPVSAAEAKVTVGRPANTPVAPAVAPHPFAWLFSAQRTAAVAELQKQEIVVEELREDVELALEADRIEKITRQPGPTPDRAKTRLTLKSRAESQRVSAGTIVVRSNQPRANLAASLLAPQSEGGLVAQGVFGDGVSEGKDLPVLRLVAATPILTTQVRPLSEKRQHDRPITLEDWLDGRIPSFSGSPASFAGWLDDGEHFLQVKEGRLLAVDARSGGSRPLVDPQKLLPALLKLPGITSQAAEALARSTSFEMNPQRTGALFTHAGDLYFCSFDGAQSVRLTKSPGDKELATFSPNGQWVAFVREQNLWVVDLATQTERALTSDGGGPLSYGKAEWVYFEEVFLRRYQAYWWSPDSTHLAFLRLDDSPVPKYTVTDLVPVRERVEITAFPQAGDPNPIVRLGMVSVAGGPIHWADRGNYSENAMLIVRAGWTPDSRTVYYYVQDRAQTWLDFCTVRCDAGPPVCLFRETTKAWVDDPGDPVFLQDGSFLLASEPRAGNTSTTSRRMAGFAGP